MSGKCDDTIIKYLLPVQKRCVSLAEPMKSRRLAHKRKSPEMNKHTSSFVAVSKCLQCCTGFFSSHFQFIVQILKVVLINSSSHFTAKKKNKCIACLMLMRPYIRRRKVALHSGRGMLKPHRRDEGVVSSLFMPLNHLPNVSAFGMRTRSYKLISVRFDTKWPALEPGLPPLTM